ncbi:unnamed protein product [Amoebophrya sp. A25]|nr:unnamed protein product [Amoebophrya sp. A25]|eukprot:GSA25T00010041001.1
MKEGTQRLGATLARLRNKVLPLSGSSNKSASSSSSFLVEDCIEKRSSCALGGHTRNFRGSHYTPTWKGCYTGSTRLLPVLSSWSTFFTGVLRGPNRGACSSSAVLATDPVSCALAPYDHGAAPLRNYSFVCSNLQQRRRAFTYTYYTTTIEDLWCKERRQHGRKSKSNGAGSVIVHPTTTTYTVTSFRGSDCHCPSSMGEFSWHDPADLDAAMRRYPHKRLYNYPTSSHESSSRPVPSSTSPSPNIANYMLKNSQSSSSSNKSCTTSTSSRNLPLGSVGGVADSTCKNMNPSGANTSTVMLPAKPHEVTPTSKASASHPNSTVAEQRATVAKNYKPQHSSCHTQAVPTSCKPSSSSTSTSSTPSTASKTFFPGASASSPNYSASYSGHSSANASHQQQQHASYRSMRNRFSPSAVAVILDIARNEGVSQLWRGFVPRIARSGPGAGISLFVYNFMLDGLASARMGLNFCEM